MSYYEDVYLRRLNRFGSDPQSRIQNQRIKLFDDLLLKSIYRVDFTYKGVEYPALLERYKQDDTQTLQYLLTRLDLNLPAGTVLEITDQSQRTCKWMIYYLEYIETSGYNRYIVIKMSHTIKWTHSFGAEKPTYYTSPGYFFGKQQMSLRDDDQGTSNKVVYLENNNDYTLVMPYHKELKKEDYFEIAVSKTATQQFRILGYDFISTPGVAFVTVDPIYQYDKSVTPEQPVGDTSNDYDWFTGNFKEE